MIHQMKLLTNTNMMTVQNFEVISDKMNAVGISTSGNCVQEWMINSILLIYSFHQPHNINSLILRRSGIKSSSQKLLLYMLPAVFVCDSVSTF
jgi:hypothetical protein